MSSGMPELGSKISLISKADIRYEGRLYTVDPTECTIALSSVRSFGTEDRETQFQIAPQSQIYDYILFRGSDIKDIRVVNNGMPHPNDPAIMQVQLPNGQHLMPHFPMPAMNPPMGNYGNPFGMGALGGMGTAGLAPGSAAGSFMLNNKQPKQPNLLAGTSRSTTPVSLISRKSPSADMAVQVNQQQQPQQQQSQHNLHQQQNTSGAGTGSNRDAGHKRQNHQQRGNNRGGGRGAIGSAGGNDSNSGGYYQRDRRDSGRIMDHQHNNYNQGHQHQQHDNRNNHYNNQRNNQQNQHIGGGGNTQNNRGWTMNRGPNNNNMGRNRGTRGRMPHQGFRQIGSGGTGVNQNKNNRNKNTIKFEQDFDFEQANNKFEELRSQLSKLKVGDEPKNEQINGETDKKDDSGNETGAGEHEPEDEEITVGYDKTKSFFDNISCEAAQDRSKSKKNDWRQERKLNSETFGVSSTRRGNYRGRGNYYNRSMNNYSGYNRSYRGGNNYNRNNNRNNRVTTGSDGSASGGGNGGNGTNATGDNDHNNLPSKSQNTQPQQNQSTNQKTQDSNSQPAVLVAGQ